MTFGVNAAGDITEADADEEAVAALALLPSLLSMVATVILCDGAGGWWGVTSWPCWKVDVPKTPLGYDEHKEVRGSNDRMWKLVTSTSPVSPLQSQSFSGVITWHIAAHHVVDVLAKPGGTHPEPMLTESPGL